MSKKFLLGMTVVFVLGGSAQWCSNKNGAAFKLFPAVSNRISSSGGHFIHELDEKFDSVKSSYTTSILNNIIRLKQSNQIELRAAQEDNSMLREELMVLSKDDDSSDGDKRLRGISKYEKGDIVEVVHNRVLAPFKVVDIHSISDDLHVDYYDDLTDDIVAEYQHSFGYDLIRATDGFKLNQIPESSLRNYEPYSIGTKALCNIGEFGTGKETSVPCSINEYTPSESSGILVLQNQYMALILDGPGVNKQFEISLPVWKLQRINNHDRREQ